VRRISVAANGRPNSGKLVGSHRCAYAAAANQNPDLSFTGLDCPTHFKCIIRIIILDVTNTSPEIDHLVPGLAEFCDYPFIEWVSCVVCADCYFSPHIY
jgi:hypothetical protein